MNELVITFAGQTQSFRPGQVVRIGRGPDNAIVVPDPIVSREHAQIRWHPDGWTLDDLGKGRTFVGGMQVTSVAVSHPLEVHLASPLGPQLRIEVGTESPSARPENKGPTAARTATTGGAGSAAGSAAGAAADLALTADRANTAVASRGEPVGWGKFTGLTGPDDLDNHDGLADFVAAHDRRDRGDRDDRDDLETTHGLGLRASTGQHVGPDQRSSPHHDRPDAPGGDFATAVHILVPVRSWLKHPGWKQGSRLLVIAYGLLPSLFVVLLSSSSSSSAPGWAYSLAIAPLWAVAFWLLIRPGHITKLIAWLAVIVCATVLIQLQVVTIPWEKALDNTAHLHNPLPWIYGVGMAEEVTKALPILVAALALRWIWKVTLDVRIWMFLGTISGLAFGVRESVFYTTSYLMPGGVHQEVPLILTFALRVFVDGFQHAVWAGIAAFFIGMGVNYRRRRIPLIVFGITLPAVLHGLNDWATTLAAHWPWIAMEALSMVLFIGYTMSAATIERQVRDTPLFRGESMIMDKAKVTEEPVRD